jgi:hypothetical protein
VNHEGTTFACGCAATAEVLFAAKELDVLVEQGKENCAFVVMRPGEWQKATFAGGWSAIAMATIKPAGKDRTVVAISPGGAYWEFEPKSLRETNGKIKTAKGSLRSLASIDDSIYACGMGRSVLKRMGPGLWDEVGPGTKQNDQGHVVGFEGLAGASGRRLYAVGWRGEVWLNENGAWSQLDSPVSANLNAVCCAPSGNVYAVGDGGTMLRGTEDQWEVLETDRTDNLMDVASYGQDVFVTSDFEVLRLSGDTVVPETAFADGGDLPTTCLHLLTAPDALFSLGTKDLFRFREGLWSRIV